MNETQQQSCQEWHIRWDTDNGSWEERRVTADTVSFDEYSFTAFLDDEIVILIPANRFMLACRADDDEEPSIRR